MGRIYVNNLGKAYKQYRSHWSRLLEWISPFNVRRHDLKWVLKNINLRVEPGEAVGIIGINGAGKSTLLKIITGTTQPTVGSVETSGRVAALLELGMGFHPDFSGYQNALMSGQLLGMSMEQLTSLMPEIEAFAEIGDYIHQPVRIYSSGMQVRLAFSVATAVRPDILIVDEALAVGDVFFQQKCYDRIRSYCEAGTTLLFVSHSMGTVYSLCDRAILLNDGGVALDASPREVIDLYNAHVLRHRDGSNMKIVDSRPAEKPQEGATAFEEPANDDAGAAETDTSSDGIGSFGVPHVSIAAVELHVDGRNANTVISDSAATIRIHVKFEAALDDPHIGFQIRNARGEPVFMTNTYCMHRTIGHVASGAEIVAEFSFNAGLAPGDYTITAGVANDGTGEGIFRQTLARRQDTTAFTVIRNIDAIIWTGVYNLDPDCTLERLPG